MPLEGWCCRGTKLILQSKEHLGFCGLPTATGKHQLPWLAIYKKLLEIRVLFLGRVVAGYSSRLKQ